MTPADIPIPESPDPAAPTGPVDTTVDAPADAEFPAGEWPDAQYQPAAPQYPEQIGDRIRIFTNVAIFGFNARETVEVFDVAEVRAAAENGLVDILDETVEESGV